MRRLFQSIVSVAMCFHAECSFAYELHTHAAITRQAYDRSVLANPAFLADMGLFDSADALGSQYYDIEEGIARGRSARSFEREIIQRVGGDPLTLQGWLMRGAIREDDVPPPFGGNPQDVLSIYDLPFYRVFNHFYDPVYNRPLTVPGALQGSVQSLNNGPVQTAVNWATGSADSFGAPNTPNTERHNHFTLVDAREAMYRAATGRDSTGNTDIGPDNTPATEAVRKAYWATVFRSLGDVVHLVQDMGQPQHTRNDGHSPVNKAVQGDHIGVFEELTEHRAGGGIFKCFNDSEANAPSLAFSNYAVPTFSSYSEAFSTTPGGNVAQGRGLADYSNRGFFSAGKNLGNTEYALPSNNPANYTRHTVTDPNPCIPTGRQTEILRGTVPDLIGGANTGVALSARGLWDVSGRFGSEIPKYAMNETVYYENADLLVTRAASYSAGIINYFFRGKIDFVKDPQNNAQYIIRNLGSEEMEGTFALYYDDVNGIRNPVPGASWQLTLSPGQDSAPVSFVAATNPAPVNSDYYLVFYGRIGAELPSTNSVGAVAIKVISEHWEPWGETLTEHHPWVSETMAGGLTLPPSAVPPAAPVDSILSLDTRVVAERGIMDNIVIRGVGLCLDESCSASVDIPLGSLYMRIRLRVASNYEGYNARCNDAELGILAVGNSNPSLAALVLHSPNTDNSVSVTDDLARIYNDGTFADYVIPLAPQGSTNVVGAFALDGRGIQDGNGGFPCYDSYFTLDIDYIDFIQ